MRIITEQLADKKWAVKQLDYSMYGNTFITLMTFDDEQDAEDYAEKMRR